VLSAAEVLTTPYSPDRTSTLLAQAAAISRISSAVLRMLGASLPRISPAFREFPRLGSDDGKASAILARALTKEFSA
jgi:hypothetical protein